MTSKGSGPAPCHAQKLRILFVESGSGRGGSSVFLHTLLSFLDRTSFEPSVAFYYENSGPDTERIRALGVPVRFLARRRPERILRRQGPGLTRRPSRVEVGLRFSRRLLLMELPHAWKLWRLIRRQEIDLVVLNNDIHYHVGGAIGAKLAGAPLICRKAGGIGQGRGVKRILTPWVDLFLCISDATERDQLLNNPQTRRTVKIPSSVDLRRFTPAADGESARRSLGIAPGRRIVANIARFGPGKGQWEFIEAAALVARQAQDAVFLIAGNEGEPDGTLDQTLRGRVAQLGIGDAVIFTGWRQDIPELLAAADIFVHCPTTSIEGLGIANLEAMAMGKPTIVTDNGGLTEAVRDGVTGLVVAPGDVAALAGSMLRLLRDRALARELGGNARALIERDFNMDKNVRRIEDILREYARPARSDA